MWRYKYSRGNVKMTSKYRITFSRVYEADFDDFNDMEEMIKTVIDTFNKDRLKDFEHTIELVK